MLSIMGSAFVDMAQSIAASFRQISARRLLGF
jgi:hypothetical protein